eukprot:jgi/Hompol1/330/HPOL_002851-RA
MFMCVVGTATPTGAVTFTNPWDVVKTRLQLQGELQSKAQRLPGAQKPYPNALSAFYRIARNEGLRGIQRGLAPAYAYQIILNGTRLGMYDPLKRSLQSALAFTVDYLPKGSESSITGVAMVTSGALSGVAGSFLASPLFLVKTRMQSYTSGNQAAAVGHQHNYVTKGMFHTLATVYRNEGIRGLWRGADASMLRTGIGSAVQLSTYDSIKSSLLASGYFPTHSGNGGIELHFAASLISSFFLCLAMTPFDVASVRMYNQKVDAGGKVGSLYKNALDCMVKTVRVEGVAALYKGFFAHYLRVGPHTILTFVFLEALRNAVAKF